MQAYKWRYCIIILKNILLLIGQHTEVQLSNVEYTRRPLQAAEYNVNKSQSTRDKNAEDNLSKLNYSQEKCHLRSYMCL